MTDRTQAPDGWRVARLGPVPEGWELRRIDGLVERVDDIRGEIEPEPTVLSCSKDHGLVPQMELFRRRLASTDTRRYKLVHPGDFVYDPNLLWSGAIARSHEQAIGIVSPVYEIFRVVRDCSQDFLFAWLMSPSRLPNYRAISMGTNVRRRRADFDDFSKLPILLPSLPEQRAIAAVLDSIDEVIERTEEVIAATERLRDALLHELLTRGVPGLHTEWKEAHGIGTIPACWDVVRLGDVAEVQTGRAVNGKAVEDGSLEVPYLSVANVKDGYLDLTTVKTMPVSEDEIGRYKVQNGDVLFTEGGDADKVGRGTVWRNEIPLCLHQNHIFAVRPNQNILYSDFLASFAASNCGKRYFLSAAKQTTNLASINASQLKLLPVPLPMPREQLTIVAALDGVDKAIEQARQEGNWLQLLKASAADALLSGRVRVIMEDRP